MEAKMIQAAKLTWGDASADVFSRSLPVLVCPKCDGPDDSQHRITVPGKPR
jgi:hypothetical protein